MADEAAGTPHVGDEVLRVAEAVHAGEVSVVFNQGPAVLAKIGDALLDVSEASQVPMEYSCRMGMCGSDPVRILEREEKPVADALRREADAGATRSRPGLPDGVRGPCPGAGRGRPAAAMRRGGHGGRAACRPCRRLARACDPPRRRDRRRVAGVTATEELRRVLPDAALTLAGQEPYDFYNRMAITRLVSESVSIDSLYLNRRDWAEARRVDYQRGVAVTAIDRANRQVETDDGNRLPYNRLVLATGARPFVPPIEGFGVVGTFVLRTLDDAVQMQQHIRRWRCRSAVVVGAGLLGLEAGYNIADLGVRVFVLDRGPWPLSRQLDEQAGALLWEMLHDLGIELLPSTEARSR